MSLIYLFARKNHKQRIKLIQEQPLRLL